jgi:hypothetical protein
MAEDVAAAAEQYAQAGRVVFPVRGKDQPLVPFAALEPGPFHVRQVRYWWRKWPDANIGLRTGDGLVVIDIDPKHGGRVDPAWAPTRTERTPSGGVHLFYASAEQVPNSAGKIAPGVDVRGYHGYVVAAPSPGYEIVVDAPIAPLPTLPMRARARAPGELPPDWEPFEPVDYVPKGSQHYYLMRYGGWLWRYGDVTEDELEAAMWDEAARVCAEPPDPADYDEQARMRSRVAWIVSHAA